MSQTEVPVYNTRVDWFWADCDFRFIRRSQLAGGFRQ